MTKRWVASANRGPDAAAQDIELTPIFHALAQARMGRATVIGAAAASTGRPAEPGPAPDPDERFRRDPLSAPLPASAHRSAPPARMILELVHDPGAGRPSPPAEPPAGHPAGGRNPGPRPVDGRGGRHRARRAVTPPGPRHGRSGSDR